MTNTVVSTNLTTRVELNSSGDSVTVLQSGSITLDMLASVATNFGVYLSGLSNSSMYVNLLGTIVGSTGVGELSFLTLEETAGGNDVFIGSTGTIIAGNSGVSFISNGNRVVNEGTISAGNFGASGYGINLADNSEVINNGSISSGSAGLNFGRNGLAINTGTINADLDGIESDDGLVLTNSGEINAGRDGITDVSLSAAAINDQVTIQNTGSIIAGENAIIAASNLDLFNTGIVSGGTNAIDAGINAIIRNEGDLSGAVSLQGSGWFDNTGTLLNDGTALSGEDMEVRNTGQIQSNLGRGIESSASGLELTNSGQVFGRSNGVSATDRAEIINSGEIISLTASAVTLVSSDFEMPENVSGLLYVDNSGLIDGGEAGISSTYRLRLNNYETGIINAQLFAVSVGEYGPAIINNAGEISGRVAIFSAGDNSVINNTGLIVGSDPFAADGFFFLYTAAIETTGDALTFSNSGTLSSGNIGILATTNADISNSGVVDSFSHAFSVGDMAQITNAEGGLIKAGGAAVTSTGQVLNFTNAGAIQAAQAVVQSAAAVSGSNLYKNSGSIATTGDSFDLSAPGTVNSSGTIDSGGRAVVFDTFGTVVNSGEMTTLFGAVEFGTGGTFLNSGLVNSSGTILSATEESRLTNTGDMVTRNAIATSVDLRVKNTGTMVADGDALISAGFIVVNNSGTIISGDKAIAQTAIEDNNVTSIVRNDGIIQADVNAMVFFDSFNVTNTGQVSADGNAILGAMTSSGKVRNMEDASIDGQGGLNLLGNFNSVFNAGDIVGHDTIGIQVGGNSTISNTGRIFGEQVGVIGGDQLKLINGGEITSSSNGVQVGGNSGLVVNKGLISAGFVGVQGFGAIDLSVLNTGDVIANQTAIDASFGNANLELTNTGTISSGNNAIQAFSANSMDIINRGTIAADQIAIFGFLNDDSSVINHGSILAGVTAISMGDLSVATFNAEVINRGTIVGDIYLGSNADLFDGRGGEMTGTVSGQGGDDLLIGSAGDDEFLGDSGNDDLRGRDGDDLLDGGAGDDMIWGGDGADSILGQAGADTIFGGAGDDVIDGGDGADTINGGDGNDFIRGGISDGVSNQFLRGDGGNDEIVGGETRDIMNGGADDDILSGFGGNDFMLGGTGDDFFTGGFGNDAIRGEEGIDTARYSGASTEFQIFLDANGTLRVNDQDSSNGNEGNDNLTGIEFLQFSDGTFAVDDLLVI